MFKSILKDSFFIFLARIFNMAVGFFIVAVISNYYSLQELGAVTFFTTFFVFAATFSLMGFEISILKLIPQVKIENNTKSAYIQIYKIAKLLLISSLFIMVLLYISSDFIVSKLNIDHLMNVFLLSLPFLLFKTYEVFFRESIRGLENIKQYSFVTILPNTIFLFLLLLFLTLPQVANTAVYLFFASILFTAVYSGFFIYKNIKKYFHDTSQELFNINFKSSLLLSLPMLFTGLLQNLSANVDIFMLTSLDSLETVGIYSIIIKIAMLVSLPLMIINSVIAPKISSLYHANHKDALKRLVQMTSLTTFLFSLLIALFIYLFDYLLAFFFPAQILHSLNSLYLLILAQLFNSFTGSIGYFLSMTGKQKVFMYIILFSTVLNIVGNYYLIPMYSLDGAVIASFISILTWNLLAFLYVKHKFGFYTISFNPRIFTGGN